METPSRSFKPYLLAAIAFAVALTALALNESIAKFISQFDVLVFIPIMAAILVSGNVHMPSEFGAYLGFFIQWLVLGLVVAVLVWLIAKRKSG